MATAGALEQHFIEIIAKEVGCQPRQVAAAADLFAESATVPFVARYRKEVTGGLDDEQLETIFKRRTYFLELAERRDAILESIADQDKLTDELEAAIRAAVTKQELEDLYLPYRPKRRTRAQIAREKGLEPLADRLLEMASQTASPDQLAAEFIDEDKGVADGDAALAGARDILAERAAENASNRARLRAMLRSQGELKVRVLEGKQEEGKVYQDYFDHSEAAKTIPSHRLLAILRGEREGFLISDLAVDDELETAKLAKSWDVALDTPCGRQVAEATADGYKRLLRPSVTHEMRSELREQAEAEAIRVFRANLEALLLQSPLGQVPVMGLDPGYRTGCKLAVVDATGRVLATDVIYPVEPRSKVEEAAAKLVRLIGEHQVHAVAIGNGTGGRETEVFARKAVREAGLGKLLVAIVPETGASV
ncbi:MAG: RNA-binding transcriptional accessory protein, partial [bacterium]|nr:RNA-binding transcriptional accessory protein [bacterium]